MCKNSDSIRDCAERPTSKETARFISTRDDDPSLGVGFIEAMLQPSAPQGGLYTFQSLPILSLEDIQSFQNLNYRALCVEIFNRLGLGLEEQLLHEVLQSYDGFDDVFNLAPIRPLSNNGKNNMFMLELFHGQTRAFKDMALQPFGRLLSHFAKKQNKTYLILVATSGDTGPATLQSFANQPNTKVICLYPRGGTSDVQRLQMTTHSAPNLKTIGLRGDFDEAQSTIKALLSNSDFISRLERETLSLSVANSVNIGRIVFQLIYHIWSYVLLLKHSQITLGERISVVVPSGNFGNILGAFFVKKMGLPIDKLVVATNVNNVLSEFINTGVYDISRRKLIPSKSPAMDILKSSNVERMLYANFGAERTMDLMRDLARDGRYSLNTQEILKIQEDFLALECDDETSLRSIAQGFKDEQLLFDPHSAIGYEVAKRFQAQNKIGKCIIVGTAEWSKFAPSVYEALKRDGILVGDSAGMSSRITDKEAIESLCALSPMISVPKQILRLFSVQEVQNEVVSAEEIEECIWSWIHT